MKKYPISRNIYKNDLFSKALYNRFNSIRARHTTVRMKYEFNFVAS